jgi:hypothetical protein
MCREFSTLLSRVWISLRQVQCSIKSSISELYWYTTLRSSLIPMYSFTLLAILLPYMDIINFRIPFSLAPEMFFEADKTVMKS